MRQLVGKSAATGGCGIARPAVESAPESERDSSMVIEQIESWRREPKWSTQRITDEPVGIGSVIDRRTVSRHLIRLGLGKRRFIDPGGENNRKPGKITARWPGHMVHLDVKKVGRIPDGGGWRIHGRDSDQAKLAQAKGSRSPSTAACRAATSSRARGSVSPRQLRTRRSSGLV